MEKVIEVSKEKFDAYRIVQDSGMTNMFSVAHVITYAHRLCDVELTKEDCIFIMENYGELSGKYK